MAIRTDRSDLPRPRDTSGGFPPDEVGTFARVLGLRWLDEDRAAGPLPTAVEGSRFRFSDSGACARAVAFAAMGAPREPLDEAGLFVANMGKWLHEQWQAAMTDLYGERFGRAEVRGGDALASGHGDYRLDHGDGKRPTAFEYKSYGGFAFKLAVGCPPASRVPQGPKLAHIIQGGLVALGMDAEDLVMIVAGRDVISHSFDDRFPEVWRRYVRQWTIPRSVWEPLARAELDRVSTIVDMVDGGELPSRKPAAYPPDVLAPLDLEPELPRRAVITNPTDGTWVVKDRDGSIAQTSGNRGWWECNYCGYQPICPGSAAGRQAITADLVQRLGMPDYPVPELDAHTAERVVTVLAGEPDPGPAQDPEGLR